MDLLLENISGLASNILAQDMVLVALGGGAIIGAIVAMILYSIIFELILPIAKKFKSENESESETTTETPPPIETAIEAPPPIEQMDYDPSRAEQVWLTEIERQLIAVRELYEAGLIAPEIYLLKSRELAEPILEPALKDKN